MEHVLLSFLKHSQPIWLQRQSNHFHYVLLVHKLTSHTNNGIMVSSAKRRLLEHCESSFNKYWNWSSKGVSLDLEIRFMYNVYSYHMKKIVHLNFCWLFLPKTSKALYSGHLVIVDTYFRNRRCPLETDLTVCIL